MTTATCMKVFLFLGAIAATLPLISHHADAAQTSLASPSSNASIVAPAQRAQRAPGFTGASEVLSCWSIYSVPSRTGSDTLRDIDALAADDTWAVGSSYGEKGASLVQHWDGSEWTIVPSPNSPTGTYHVLEAVEAISPTDIWAGGSWYVGNNRGPLMMHWDGSKWTLVPTPGFPWIGDISAVSTDDVWAIGGGYNETLAMHWDGSEWTNMPVPQPPDGHMVRIVAVAANDVWVAGVTYNTPPPPAMYHWDGSQWEVVELPLGTTAFHSIDGLSALPSGEIWAVGQYAPQFSGVRPLSLRWDGSEWNLVPMPDAPTGFEIFNVEARTSDDVWALGRKQTQAWILRWDGAQWATVLEAPFSVNGALLSAAAISEDDVWAVGGFADQRPGPLVFRFTDSCTPPTGTPTPTTTISPFITETPLSTGSPTSTPTSTPVPPRCPGERFTDVCPTDYFYQHVLDLNNLGVLTGYNTVPPCDGPLHVPCFRPYNWTTRGQVSKIVSLAAGFNEPVYNQTFEDVPFGHTFHEFIERMAVRGVIIGYPCGGPGEPCSPWNIPYFRPGVTVNRAQLSKIAALSFGFQDPVSGQTFEDVVPDNHFYPFIENLASRSIINGYACGGPGEPCILPDNRPYFRYGNPITRGQIAKIVNLARIQATPSLTPTFTSTPVSTHTDTPTSTGTLTSTANPQSPTPTGTLAVGGGGE